MYSPRNRGSRRGASHRGRSVAPSSASSHRPTNDRDIMDGLKPSVLQELRIPDALPEYRNVVPMRLKPIASYNWIDEKTSTILVPGCPPIWQNKPMPFRVPPDDENFIGNRRFRAPKYPLLPLVASINHLHPDFDFASIDIVTNRSNLRKLLGWIEGTRSNGRDFRIDLERAGASTVLFTRSGTTDAEYNSIYLSYGLNFEACTTKPLVGCEKSRGHHRIITYDYGGLKLIVRFEVDACLPFDSQSPDQNGSAVHQRPVIRNDSGDLLTARENLSISSNDEVDIISVGILAPQSSLIEMTTKRKIRWQDRFPQLFLSQTPHHYLGIHDKGEFYRINAQALNNGILAKQQKVQQEAFDKLYALLQMIYRMTIDGGDAARLSLVYRGTTKKLEVFERFSPASALPDSWMRRFEVPSPETLEDGSGDTIKSTATGLEPAEDLPPSRVLDSKGDAAISEEFRLDF